MFFLIIDLLFLFLLSAMSLSNFQMFPINTDYNLIPTNLTNAPRQEEIAHHFSWSIDNVFVIWVSFSFLLQLLIFPIYARLCLIPLFFDLVLEYFLVRLNNANEEEQR